MITKCKMVPCFQSLHGKVHFNDNKVKLQHYIDEFYSLNEFFYIIY